MSGFLDDYQPLPPPGGYVTRRPCGPCGDCGETVFEVVRCRRKPKQKDATIREWVTVDVQCPNCVLLSASTVVAKRRIGTFDTATGKLDIGPARAILEKAS